MGKRFGRLATLQLVSCIIGMVAGFVPGVSFTGRFYGLDYMGSLFSGQGDDQRVRVIQAQRGTPAARAGFRQGDIIDSPRTLEDFEAALDAVRQGESKSFIVQRGEEQLTLDVAQTEPEVAAIWYANVWYPIAGALFLGIAILVFGTSPIVPPPWWRLFIVMFSGLAIATGFGVAMAFGSVFSRLRVYQQWPMGVGEEWYLHQGLIGIVAGVLLAIFATAEIRQRLIDKYHTPNSTDTSQ